MRFGILGSARDSQCVAVARALQGRGAQVVMVESSAFDRGEECSFDGETFFYRGSALDDIGGWYIRRISSPLPPAFMIDDEFYLYADWMKTYMHRRERFGYLLSWLLTEQARGVVLLNPPEHGAGVQMKLFQLARAKAIGLDVPRTLISNCPDDVRRFAATVQDVVYKPSQGGDLCRPLDAEALLRLHQLRHHPVTFQERVVGTSIRVTIVGQEIVSAVKISTPELDYRADPNYRAGQQEYEEVDIPDSLSNQILRLMKDCGLDFAGVDVIETAGGRHVFLEANSSPVNMDIEKKLAHPISDRIACYLLTQSARPGGDRREERESFVPYALPFPRPRPESETKPMHEVSANERKPVRMATHEDLQPVP